MDATTWPIADIGEIMDALFDAGQNAHEAAFEHLFWFANTLAATLPLFVLVLLLTTLGRRSLAPWASSTLWTLVLVRMIMPISVSSPVSIQMLWPIAAGVVADKPLPTFMIQQPATSGFNGPTVAPPSRKVQAIVDWLDWFSTTTLSQSVQALFVAVTMLVAVGILFSFHRLIGWLRFGERLSDPACLDLIEEGRRQFGIRARVRVLKVHQLDHAAVFDWFCPWILLPESFSALAPEQQRSSLWHAMGSIRRGDSIISLLASITRVFQWWNPLFWWVHQAWLTERMLACDRLALRQMSPASQQDCVHFLSNAGNPSRGSWLTPWIDPPGLVTSSTRPQITSRRLAALNPQATGEGRWQYWSSWCVISVVATIGLTDPVPVSLKDLPIYLPPGTTWEDVSPEDSDDTPLEQRDYDLERCVSKLQSDDPSANEETIARLVRHFISMQPGKQSSPAPPAADSPVWVDGQKLSVHTTPQLHDRIRQLIQGWELRSRRQVCIETRWLSTALDLRDLLPSEGGFLVSSQIETGAPSNLPGSFRGITTNSITQLPLPVFARVLKDAEFIEFANRVMGNVRVCQSFAPRVTSFEGETATFSLGSSRPFVTGFRQEKSGVTIPQVSSAQDGIGNEFIVLTESDKIHIRLSCRFTRIEDVFQRKLKFPTMTTMIQVPSLRSEVIRANVTLGSDESLLLVPLVRDESGRLKIQVINARVIEPDE